MKKIWVFVTLFIVGSVLLLSVAYFVFAQSGENALQLSKADEFETFDQMGLNVFGYTGRDTEGNQITAYMLGKERFS